MPVTCPKCLFENPDETRFCGNCAAPLPASKPDFRQTETLQTSIRELTTGATFAGRYQVIEELGHGGMGRVYKVHDTKRSDIYSLGVVLYEMVAGQPPFKGDTPFAIGIKHKGEIPRNPRELNTQIPVDPGLPEVEDARKRLAGL